MIDLSFEPPDSPPRIPLDRKRFKSLRGFVVRQRERSITESMLQAAILELAQDAVGLLDEESETHASLWVDPNIDLDDLLDPVEEHRIPARLMDWRAETRSLGIRTVRCGCCEGKC